MSFEAKPRGCLLRALAPFHDEKRDGHDDHDYGNDHRPIHSHSRLLHITASSHACARTTAGSGLYNVSLGSAELQTVLLLFLEELNRFHTILSQAAIKFAAIDTECGGGSYLVAAELL